MSIESKINHLMFNGSKKCELSDIKIILQNLEFQKNFQVITITGTNGKGTTVAMLTELLVKNNKNVITHISPHIFNFNERISVNSKPIIDETLLKLLDELIIKTNGYRLGYYQIAFLCCCLLTKYVNINFLILEIGIGGRLDPANIIDADIAGITNISLDHCDVLGDTVDKIGLEKVAISRNNKPLFLGSEMPNSVLKYAENIKAKVFQKKYIPKNKCLIDSYNIAKGISEYLYNTNFIKRNDIDLSNIKPKARCMLVKEDDINKNYIIVDVAHNEASVKYLFSNIKDYIQTKKITCNAIFGLLDGKDIEQIIDISSKYVNKWNIFDLTKVDNRAMKTNNIVDLFNKNNITNIQTIDNFNNLDLNEKNTITVIFGSFVLAGEFLKYYDNK